MGCEVPKEWGDELANMVLRMHATTMSMSAEQKKFYAAGIEDAISVFTASAMVVNRDCSHLSAYHKVTYAGLCKMVNATADFVRLIITGGK